MASMKTLVLLSGGIDSAVAAWDSVHGSKRGYETEALLLNYGQRHSRELQSAQALARVLAIKTHLVDLSALRTILSGCLVDDSSMPQGHFEAESMKATVVPYRNQLFLTLAAMLAVKINARRIVIGAHAGDRAIYPDCRPEFLLTMQRTLDAASDASAPGIIIDAPLLLLNKVDIIRRGAELQVPFELTWTCYEGRDKACGKCGACQERLLAFGEAGIKDPAEYEHD